MIEPFVVDRLLQKGHLSPDALAKAEAMRDEQGGSLSKLLVSFVATWQETSFWRDLYTVDLSLSSRSARSSALKGPSVSISLRASMSMSVRLYMHLSRSVQLSALEAPWGSKGNWFTVRGNA